MPSARIQPFCKKYDVNIGCFDGTRKVFEKLQKEINHCTYNILFCLTWKSNCNSFNRGIEEIKLNTKVVDNVTSDKHVKSFVKYETDS